MCCSIHSDAKIDIQAAITIIVVKIASSAAQAAGSYTRLLRMQWYSWHAGVIDFALVRLGGGSGCKGTRGMRSRDHNRHGGRGLEVLQDIRGRHNHPVSNTARAKHMNECSA